MKNPDQLSDEAILTLAQERIRDPAHWTQHTLARDRLFREVAPNSPEAVSFCAAGAIANVLGVAVPTQGGSRFHSLWERLSSYPPVRSTDWRSPAHYNNSRSHAEVMAMFDWTRKQVSV